jgi:hypothetical protein
MFLLSLNDGNQSELILAPAISGSAIETIQAKYKWNRFDEYDNRYWEYRYAPIDPVLNKAHVKRVKSLWHKLTRPQKVFYAVLTFDGQIDNGGVWQFLFNYPELSLAALEALSEIESHRLVADYRITLEELLGKAKTFADLRRRATQKGPTAQKWAAFMEGYDQLQTAQAIEKYFHAKKFKKELYQQVCDYIERRMDRFARIRE